MNIKTIFHGELNNVYDADASGFKEYFRQGMFDESKYEIIRNVPLEKIVDFTKGFSKRDLRKARIKNLDAEYADTSKIGQGRNPNIDKAVNYIGDNTKYVSNVVNFHDKQSTSSLSMFNAKPDKSTMQAVFQTGDFYGLNVRVKSNWDKGARIKDFLEFYDSVKWVYNVLDGQ